MIRSIIPTITLAIALTTGASAFAQDTISVKVKYGDLKLTSSAGARAFHQRLQTAVDEICGQPDPHDAAYLPFVEQCQRDTWAATAQTERQALAVAQHPTEMAVAASTPPAR